MQTPHSAIEHRVPRALNVHTDSIPAEAVHVGRGTKWGNPFHIGRDGTRQEVVAQYARWILRQPHLMTALHELTGKDLVCFCAPRTCHAYVLLVLANPWLVLRRVHLPH